MHVMIATAVCTMMATLAGCALVLMIVDGASRLRRMERPHCCAQQYGLSGNVGVRLR
jgi:hypothetical protein